MYCLTDDESMQGDKGVGHGSSNVTYSLFFDASNDTGTRYTKARKALSLCGRRKNGKNRKKTQMKMCASAKVLLLALYTIVPARIYLASQH